MSTAVAHINVVRFKHRLGSGSLQSFVELVDPVNRAAEKSDGFIWRHAETGDGSIDIVTLPDKSVLGALSMWESVSALRSFVYRNLHGAIMARRGEWMESTDEAMSALWLIDKADRPSVAEAWDRLTCLRTHGSTRYAFDFTTAKLFALDELR